MSYLCGLDLGQSQDYTALTIVERQGSPAVYAVVELRRFPLGTPYPTIVEEVRTLLATPPLSVQTTSFWDPAQTTRAPLVLDATGVGAAVSDMFLAAHLQPLIMVKIHGGDTVSHEGHTYRVPKRDLVGVIQVLLQDHRLRIASALPEAAQLQHELEHFKATIDPTTAHDSYAAWREADHDDLVLAVTLACWWGDYGARHRAGTWGR